MVMNDYNDQHHEEEKKRLKMTWQQYWYHLAVQRVGDETEQVADVLAQLRAGSWDNQVRADTIERLLKHLP